MKGQFNLNYQLGPKTCNAWKIVCAIAIFAGLLITIFVGAGLLSGCAAVEPKYVPELSPIPIAPTEVPTASVICTGQPPEAWVKVSGYVPLVIITNRNVVAQGTFQLHPDEVHGIVSFKGQEDIIFDPENPLKLDIIVNGKLEFSLGIYLDCEGIIWVDPFTAQFIVDPNKSVPPGGIG